MTQPQQDPTAAQPGGYEPPAAPPYQGQQYPAGPQVYPQPQGYAPAPAQQYQGQPPVYAYGYQQSKSKLAAGLLGIFLGGLGIHRFYLGYTKVGVIQLILTVVLAVFTFGLVGLWGFIEGIMILAGAAHFRTDAQGVPLRD